MISTVRTRRARGGFLVLGALLIAFTIASSAPVASGAPTPPTGLSAYTTNARVTLAWQPVSGATSYRVYRGTSSGTITTNITPLGVAGTSYTDTTAVNGTTYWYTVRAVNAGVESSSSRAVSAAPASPSCTTGNAIARENCLPGDTGWKIGRPGQVAAGGIEGFVTQTSVAAGSSVDVKVNVANNAPYHIDVYRTGWYGGTQGRKVGTLRGLVGSLQDACTDGAGNTGLLDCANWTTAATLTTTSDWVSGVYLLKLVRDDNGAENHVLLVVRDDARAAPVVYGVPVTTYQAYNNWGGRSLYDWNSSGANTVAGTARAVKVSFDRPYNLPNRDFFTTTDIEATSWLERQGYDMSYATSVDLDGGLSSIPSRRALLLGAHDEYWTSGMRSAAEAARDGGTGLFFLGGNSVYWRSRFEASPVSGAAKRVLVVYKTTQGGIADPVSPTGTWRDPAGINQPENALIGQQYVGDNDNGFFPLRVSAAQGRDRVWRYTTLTSLAAGTTEDLGRYLVGWEWDARAANGREPAGVRTVAASPVTGELLTDSGKVYAAGSATATTTVYKAASGATVFSTGTNHWARGLGLNMDGEGEPLTAMYQATANVLGDMGATPTTPVSVTADAAGPLQISSRTPASGATGVAPTSTVKVVFDRPLDPATIADAQLTVTKGGAPVAGAVSYDDASRTLTFTPTGGEFDGATTYVATVGAGLKGWNGQGLGSASSWSFTTQTGPPPTVGSRTPASGATGVALGANVTATFDRTMDPATLDGTTVRLASAGGSVTGTVTYDAPSRTVTIDPTGSLSANTVYTATITTGATASDGAAVAADVTWSFTTRDALTLAGRTPAPLASGISTATDVRATFNQAIDPATLTASTFTLTGPAGAVAATRSYDAATRTAALVPSAALAPGTNYTATLTTGLTTDDGAPLGAATSWTFTTSLTAVPAPAVTSTVPAAGATGVATASIVQAVSDRALDPGTVTAQNVTLEAQGGVQVAATVSYDDATRTIALRPTAALAIETTYVARVTTRVRSTLGQPLAAEVSWSFTTAKCPCSLMAGLTPASTGNPIQDGRSGTGPFTYELGTKIQVDRTMKLTSIRFWKDPGETGTHVGRVWSGTTQLASVTFANESASGWQRAALATPLTLSAGTTYIVSVGFNTKFAVTVSGLATPLVSGPLSSLADGANGVYANAAGQAPTNSWSNSNYFVDAAVVSPSGTAITPHVVSMTPASGASGVATTATPTATFDVPLNPATVTSSTVQMKTGGGTVVPASVAYDPSLQRITVTPTYALALSSVYSVTIGTGVKSDDETPLPSAYTWSFTTTAGGVPHVATRTPAASATEVSPTSTVEATFDADMQSLSINGSTFQLRDGNGALVPATVAYNAATRRATLTPSSALGAASTYTATVTTGATSLGGLPLPAADTWSFTTSTCPCTMHALGDAPALTGLSTQDGRTGAGPFTYELGTKFQVAQAANATAIRFYKSSGETGTHIGRLWTASGQQIATVTFSGETGSGWQQADLSSPVDLSAGQTYVVSVGFNSEFVLTGAGLASSLTSGPLSSVPDGANGVFAGTAGTFPTGSWNNGDYFVDVAVR